MTNKPNPFGKSATVQTIGELIRYQRERKGWSQQDLGDRLEPRVDQSRISKWEADDSKPRKDRLIQMAKLFGIAPIDLIEAVRTGVKAGRVDNRYIDAYSDVDALGDREVLALFVRIVVALASLVKMIVRKRSDST